MKYIKLFENYESELFDHTINDIKKILDLRKTKYIDVTHIASGSYGSAFDLGNNLVLKITTMKSEVYYARKLIGIDSKYLIDVKDCFFHTYSDMGYNIKIGFIIEEKLNMNKGNIFKRFVDILYRYDSPKSKDIPDKEFIEYFNSYNFETETLLKYRFYYNEIIQECKKYDLPIDDLRGDNIGFRNDTPVLFDIGDIHKSYKHNYSNIDEIELYIH